MEPLKHECGIAVIRLRKPLEHYQEKYGSWQYGLNKLYLMMEKQHNRGQEGAGISCVKLQADPGEEYMFREKALGSGAISEIFATVQESFRNAGTAKQIADVSFAKKNQYVCTDGARTALRRRLSRAVASKDKDFGNARFVRNLFERAIEYQAQRLSSVAPLTPEILEQLSTEDLESC